ncbi:protein of unknown function (plasmid) [Cupriavidus taiwanensis]|uniref:Uncharacterized protein n=1 Tax=Cupriavidus taiwanensis TaxID=164546 RepID=A0A9Q7UU58_9BURK|nr:protein of unknown function [Cupriavidus taiwanensis]
MGWRVVTGRIAVPSHFRAQRFPTHKRLRQASPACSECDNSYRLPDSGREYWVRHRVAGDRAWKPAE